MEVTIIEFTAISIVILIAVLVGYAIGVPSKKNDSK